MLRMPITTGWRSASSRSSGCEARSCVGPAKDAGLRTTLMGRLCAARQVAVKARLLPPCGAQAAPSASIGNLQRELLGLRDPAFDSLLRGKQPHQLFLAIGIRHCLGEIADIAIFELLD